MIIDVRISDNDNEEYELITEVEITNIDWLVIKDNMNTYDSNEYHNAWNYIRDCIKRQVHNLPYTWCVEILTPFEEK